MRPASLLIAHLHDLFRAEHGLLHELALFDGVADGLLDVDVLARLHRVHRHGDVPVVRRADHHAVDIVAPQHLPVIQVILATGSELLFRRQAAGLGNIADRYDLGVLRLGRQAQQVGGATAHAEAGNAYTLVGAEDTAIGGGRPDGGRFQKIAAFYHMARSRGRCPIFGYANARFKFSMASSISAVVLKPTVTLSTPAL